MDCAEFDVLNAIAEKVKDGPEHLDSFSVLQILSEIKDHAQISDRNQTFLGSHKCIEFADWLLDDGHLNMFNDEAEIILENVIWSLVQMCRRVILQKDTVCLQNLVLCQNIIERLVIVARAHISNCNVVLAACTLMMILASDSEINQQKFGECEACQLIVDILDTHALDENVSEMTCRVVRNFSSNDDLACKLMDCGVGDRLVKLLQSDACAKLLEAAVWAVVNLSYDEDVAVLLGSVGCCSAVVTAFSKLVSTNSATATGSFCWAVRNLSCPTLNLGIFASTDVCEVVLRVVDANRDHLDVLQSAIWCVNNLSCSGVLLDRLHLLQTAELIIPLCKLLASCTADDLELGPVAEATVFALRGLSASRRKIPPSTSSTVTSTTANDAVVNESKVIAAEGDDLDRDADGFDADSCDNQARLGELHAPNLVCSLLERFIDREAMVESCLATIAALCRDCDFNKDLVRECGGLAVLLDAIAKHKDVLETVEIGLKCLLVTINDNSLSCLLQMDAAKLVVQYMKLHRVDYDVCTVSCQLLLRLHYTEQADRERLRSLNQLGEDGLNARPAGRFEDIALAWCIDEI